MSDSLYHRLFSHALMVEQLVRAFVPTALALDLDFGAMSRVNARFDERGGRRRESDVIWRIPSRTGLDLYLYLLIEFQSQCDWWMAVRTQVYQGLLWQHLIAEQRLRTGDGLPPVLLIVLYNGDTRWSAPTELAKLIDLPSKSPLWPWQPQVRYHLLDMASFAEPDLARQDSLAALLFRLEQWHQPAELAALIDQVIGWFRNHPEATTLRQLFAELVRQSINGTGVPVPLPTDLMEIRTMLATQGQRWAAEWKAQGKAEGRAEGKAEGRAEGKADLLVRLLQRRFGPLPDDLEARLRRAPPEALDGWTDRLFEASSLADLFDEDGTR